MEVLAFILIAIFFVGITWLKIHDPSIKGKIGEKCVAATLSFLPEDECVVLNDLMFKSGFHTTQIDHIVISVYGIFVIETKNYKGWIYGNSNKDYWIQNIWGNKYLLYNPILQNKNHIKFLIRKFNVLREKEQWIYPIVVFINASKLHLSGDCENVLLLRKLNSYIRSYNQYIMTMEDCHYISAILQANNIEDKNERKVHRTNVRTAIIHHEKLISQGVCPNCGGKLVLRTGKYGNFYGCSNYPRCRYTR